MKLPTVNQKTPNLNIFRKDMRLAKNTFCHASVLRGPRRAVARWGEEERCQRLSPTAGRARQSGISDDEAA